MRGGYTINTKTLPQNIDTMSRARTLRLQGWRRWRYAVAVGHQVGGWGDQQLLAEKT